jgi:hypothetical protein
MPTRTHPSRTRDPIAPETPSTPTLDQPPPQHAPLARMPPRCVPLPLPMHRRYVFLPLTHEPLHCARRPHTPAPSANSARTCWDTHASPPRPPPSLSGDATVQSCATVRVRFRHPHMCMQRAQLRPCSPMHDRTAASGRRAAASEWQRRARSERQRAASERAASGSERAGGERQRASGSDEWQRAASEASERATSGSVRERQRAAASGRERSVHPRTRPPCAYTRDPRTSL